MIITDTITCQNCEKDINWYYQIPQRLSSRLEVDVIPRNKSKIFRCVHKEDKLYDLTCYCPKCDSSNTFEYDSEHKLHIN